MEISYHSAGDWTELRIRGRLDGYWSDHFAQALDDKIRAGAHHLRLNLSEVVFLSSAGIRVLVRFFKQLQAIQGRLVVINPSEPVKEVLEISGLTRMLIATASAALVDLVPGVPGIKVERPNISFELFQSDAPAAQRCRMLGDPGLLMGCRFGPGNTRRLRLPENTLAVGLGALGKDFEDCRGRFGEFLAVAGTAAYLPTDGTGVPDYLVAHGDAVPDLEVCYALLCEGSFSLLARFDTSTEAPITLATLLEHCLELASTQLAAVVLIAETQGLMGAALRRSPVGGSAAPEAPFAFPGVRDWLSFTAESAFSHALSLVVGVVGRNPPPALAPFVRPLSAGLIGHCHAAAFSYQPLPKGAIGLQPTVAGLFEMQTLRGVLHLLNDTRPITGGGQSSFVRGACWVGPIADVAGGAA
jgi:anti-anti-sigma factor